MAEPKYPNKLFPSFLQKALLFILFAFVLPQIPSQAPEFITNQTILNKGFELIYLLFIGIMVSYGLFSRKNTDPLPVKEIGPKPDNPSSYVSQIIPSLGQDEEGDEDGEVVQQTWRKEYYPNEPLLVISNGKEEKNQNIDKHKPLFLPVRSLNVKGEGSNKDENISALPSPIPWRAKDEFNSSKNRSTSGRIEAKDEYNSSKIRSRSGRVEAKDEVKRLSPSPSPSPSPSLSPSISRENSAKKKNLFREITSLPPAPPPPPPPFHYDRRVKSTVKKCFKEELMDMTMRNQARDFVANPDYLPKQRKNSIDGSSSSYSISKDDSIRSSNKPIYGYSRSNSMANDEFKDEIMRSKGDLNLTSSKPIRPRNSFEGSNSSSIAKSVRTIRKNSMDISSRSNSMDKDELNEDNMRSKGDLIAKSVRTIRAKELQNEPANNKILNMEPFLISSENDESDSSGSDEGETEYDEYSDKEVMVKEKEIKEKEEENEVDKKADEFIAKFREQIRLQRIESIKRSAGERAVRSHKKKMSS